MPGGSKEPMLENDQTLAAMEAGMLEYMLRVVAAKRELRFSHENR
jgi:hypothetical protein